MSISISPVRLSSGGPVSTGSLRTSRSRKNANRHKQFGAGASIRAEIGPLSHIGNPDARRNLAGIALVPVPALEAQHRMKPGIGVSIGWPPMDPQAGAPEGCNDMGRIGSAAFASNEWKSRSKSKAQRHEVICVTSCYDAPSARVFGAWLDPEVAGQWLFATASRPMAHAEIDARVEGSFRFMD